MARSSSPDHSKSEGRFNIILFVALHIACFAALWTGVHVRDLLLCFALYAVRMFGVTAGYHRYFSHRTFKTSRVMQCLLAILAMSSGQKGVLWWASHHRHHHKHSDTEHDVHSPHTQGFWWSHVGWVLSPRWDDTDLNRVKDLTRYPELVWLDRYFKVPIVALGVGVWWFAGWSGLVVGFLWSTVLLWHGTFTINSLSHLFGSRRYPTKDDSRNNWLLALITLGEGWHNNHHHYQASTRQGFFWWEFDITYYVLKVMSWFRLVWALREPPAHVVKQEPHPAKTPTQARRPTKPSPSHHPLPPQPHNGQISLSSRTSAVPPS